MKHYGNLEAILNIILGKEKYESFISKVCKDYNKKVTLNDLETIIYNYSILIFIFGMFNNENESNKFNIIINNKKRFKVEKTVFNEKYSEYIEKIKRFKLELLNEYNNS